LFAGKDETKTLALRRYVLGLALTAFTRNPAGYLRQGCMLVQNPDKGKENEFVEVYPTGKRKPAAVTHDDALIYATEAAAAFGVGKDFESLYAGAGKPLGEVQRQKAPSDSEFVTLIVTFDPQRAKRDVKGEGDAKGKKKEKKAKAEKPEVVEGE
jgi:CRISPR-associated protein Csb1